MPRVQWKHSRTIALCVTLVLLYLAIRIRNYEHKASVLISKIHPNEAWEFVADFSNMKYLNPTIVDFAILNESGNYDQWKYSTQYSENLSHWPYMWNYAVAHFDVKANAKQNTYYINSLHKTCMMAGFFCLDSQSEFKFTKNSSSDGALCEEYVIYQCPVFLSHFCRREVVFQRDAIMNNLKNHFAKKH